MFILFETFLSVYDTRNFTRSAENLFVSQPTVTVRIKRIEDELNTTLFIRDKNQEIIPTESAHIFYSKAIDYLKSWNKIKNELEQKKDEKHIFKISVSQSASTSVMPTIFKELMEYLPMLNLNITQTNSKKVFDLVHNHENHFGIIEKPIMGDRLSSFPLFKDELVLAGNINSGIFFKREEGSGINYYTNKYLKENNILYKNIVYMNNNNMIIAHIKAGIGASIISKKFIDESIPYITLNKKFHRIFYGIYYTDEHDSLIKHLINKIKQLSEFI